MREILNWMLNMQLSTSEVLKGTLDIYLSTSKVLNRSFKVPSRMLNMEFNTSKVLNRSFKVPSRMLIMEFNTSKVLNRGFKVPNRMLNMEFTLLFSKKHNPYPAISSGRTNLIYLKEICRESKQWKSKEPEYEYINLLINITCKQRQTETRTDSWII